ncbi:MAG: sigma-54-dependent Fis family transcriptional regulator [Calditrichaeota bacterium]|nr:MAG: sigma-54-dependent Fis family transcriptional regulator [Calditrichota bacterium]
MRKLKVLIIDDENLICWSFKKRLDKNLYEVLTADSGENGLEIFEAQLPDIIFLDNKLPGMQGLEVLQKIKTINPETYVVFMTAYGTIESAVKAMKLGAFDFINKPFTFEEIEKVLQQIREKMELENELQVLRRQHAQKETFDHIVGTSPAIREVVQMAKKIAKSEASTILLLGESGTGKDLLAKVIHNESSRGNRPFVTINCASLPETLLESELFGYEKGAFTDARQQKKGLFEIADGGTVYLDEIGEINFALQVKLLGVIENRTVRRLGGTTDINVDVRIIAATNRDLEEAIAQKTFREDLYYRLKVFQLTLPPLRERKEDIPELIQHFIQSFSNHFRKQVKGITKEAEELLVNYDWPGNIRELRNVIERAVILESDEYIHTESLPVEIRSKPTQKSVRVTSGDFYDIEIPDEGISLAELEKVLLEKALEKTNYNQSKAARLLGITRDSFRSKKKRYKL